MGRVAFGVGLGILCLCTHCGGGSSSGSGGQRATATGGAASNAYGSATGGKSSSGGKSNASGGAAGSSGTANGGTATGGAAGSSGTANGGTESGGDTGTSGATASCMEPEHMGPATYYTTADGTGNCSFDASPDDLMIGAMNHVDYDGSEACGGCADIVGPMGEITVRVVDQCPDCDVGHIDLSPEAFQKIAPLASGRVSITWKYVACAVTGPIVYRFKEGSNQWWTAVQIRNHRNRIAKFEYQNAGAFVEVPRLDYNYFVEASGMGPGPFTFRVTDVYGGQVTDTGIVFKEAAEVSGASQLPACTSP
jgi:expansin (peptidoglycan-binding protein)